MCVIQCAGSTKLAVYRGGDLVKAELSVLQSLRIVTVAVEDQSLTREDFLTSSGPKQSPEPDATNCSNPQVLTCAPKM